MNNKVIKYFYRITFEDQYPSFYFINALGWFAFITIDSIVIGAQYEWKLELSAYLANYFQWSVGYLVTILMRIFYKKLYLAKVNFWLKLVYVTFISILGACLIFILALLIFSLYFYPDIIETLIEYFNTKYVLFRLTQLIPMMMAWSMLYFGIKLWIDVSGEKEKAEKANLLTQNAQLQMLRYQVNPHFLFNSFSSLRALIRKNPTAAADMVTKLSEFYRYSLLPKKSALASIKDEIEALQFYCDIEKIRFEDRIQFSFEIETETEELLIPSFIIHPIVENAVKYGLLTSKIPLKISIRIYFEGNNLITEVTNSGKWYTNVNNRIGTGTGISNIKNRLDLMYRDKYSFDIIKSKEFVSVILKLAKEQN